MRTDSNGVLQPPTGQLVFVLRNALGDCTANGVSARFATLIDAATTPRPDLPAVRIVSWYGYYKAVPVDVPAGSWLMFGGNYLTSSDSRWRERYPHPIPIHDRIER